MAANRIKGITIEIGGDTTNLQKALKGVDKSLKDTQASLKDVNKLLKLDPTNTELLKQKQKLLKEAIEETNDRLRTLKEAYSQIDGNASEEAKRQQDALAREIADTEQKLKSLKDQYKDFGTVAKQQLQYVGEEVQKFGSKVSDAGQSLSVKLTAPIIALGTMGVAYNAQVEQYQKMFTTLTGSAEEADQIIRQLQEDAQRSPFDSSSLIQANQYLISAGVSAEEARKTILDLGNAVAATGGGSSELERMAQNLQQIKNVGKATSQDIKQFANAGINIYGLLAEATGKSVEKVKEMDVSYELLSQALAKASEEGGKYYGAMEAQSETLNGSLSATKASIQALLGEITQAAMPIIVNILQKVRDIINAISNLDGRTKKIILVVASIVAAVGPVLVIIGKIITIIGTLISAIGAIANPITAIISAIGLFVAAINYLIEHMDKIRETADKVWDRVATDFEKIKNAISDKLNSAKNAVKSAIDQIKSYFNFQWELPKLKLPHITISGKFSLNPPSVPKFSIEWYAKAMEKGMILNNPTIFGMMGGKLLGAGEAGSETIVGTNSLMEMITKAVGQTAPTINMTVNGGNVNANELADIVIDKLTTTIQRNNQRW